jgi:outer membrane protein TolC
MKDALSKVGPSITLPIFRDGQLRCELRLRQAEQRKAAVNFQKTVLQAWADVDNALTAFAEALKRKQDAEGPRRSGHEQHRDRYPSRRAVSCAWRRLAGR